MKPDLPAGVAARLERYSPEQRDVILRYFEVLRGTRKTGKIAPSVLCKQLDYFARYPAELVARACEIHVRRYPRKSEAYTRGILRGIAREEGARRQEGGSRRGGYGRGRYANHYVRDLPVR